MAGFDISSLFRPQGYSYLDLGNGTGRYMPQPSAAESIGTALPFLSLPGKQQRYMQPAYDTFAAAANSNSPQYQQIYGEQKQQGQQNLAETIAELSRQNRKLSMLGRAPLFSNERGGEQQFRALTQGYQDVQNHAANDTRGILNTLAQNQMVQGQQQGQIAGNKAGIKGNLLGAGAKFLPYLFGL